MEITLQKVDETERQTLWNLLQYLLFETSSSGQNVANPDGSFSYQYFENYFTDNDREAYLIKTPSEELAGLVMINQYLQKVKTGHAIAEFLILPRFRRQGIGKEVAKRCFKMHPGNWEVGPAKDSVTAHKFWENVINEVTGQENRLVDGLYVFRI